MPRPTLAFPAGTNISVGSSVEKTARVLKADFGMGANRAKDGRNVVSSEYSIVADVLTGSEAEMLDAFFTERAGAFAFIWTPPGTAVPRLWTCEKWGSKVIGPDLYSITATFAEVFEP